mmetsp:Transcript_107879/g.300822  ORF Transcript_107879/g.300822 Transcript_107879/m.300822 type:complete len:355 (-) Transcript_107879:212-1276(-)
MSPIEDLQSRDLAWISDFVMQQMVIMLRPMMDHLQQTDAAVDYAQRVVQRLSMDVSEVKCDVERTNKYLAILRQGLGVQNEGKCMLQRGLESTARTVKRLDDQMESILGLMRGVEDSVSQQHSDSRAICAKQEDLAKQVAASASALEDLQAQVERVSNDARAAKDGLLDSEARFEGWQRELRELRRGQLGIVPKLEDKAGRPPPTSQQSCRATAADPWPPKKIFAPVEVSSGGVCAGGAPGAGGGLADTTSSHSGSSQQSKRINRVGSGSGREHLELGPLPPRTASRAAARGDGPDAEDAVLFGGDEPLQAARLPTLTPKQPGGARPSERSTAEGPRLRFTATMASPPSRGSPS